MKKITIKNNVKIKGDFTLDELFSLVQKVADDAKKGSKKANQILDSAQHEWENSGLYA